MNWKLNLFICILIATVASGLIVLVYSTEPTATQVTATKETPMLVQVTEVTRGTYRPVIVAMGTVRAEQEIQLSPRVAGEITGLSEAFSPGGFVNKGDWLVQIDPADYEAIVLERESALHQAEAELALELGRQDVAQLDYNLMARDLNDLNEALVLRKPQLEAAKANLEAAEGALFKARLDLQRTRITAPFDAHILSREANLGSLVSPGTVLARLVGIDTYWVEAAVPLSKVNWIQFPGQGDEFASPVQIYNRTAWTAGVFRKGQASRLVGELDSRTRMARVLITVEDPLSRQPSSAGQPPLIVGSYVEARIEGRPIEDVIRLERSHVRKDDTVWVMEDEKLSIRPLEILFTDETHVYIRSGLSEGDRVVTTNLSTVRDGAPLRTGGASQ